MKFFQSVCLLVSLTSVVSCNSDDFIDGDFYYGTISYQCGPTDQLVLEVQMTDRKVQQCTENIAINGPYLKTYLEGTNMDSFTPQLNLYPHNYGEIYPVVNCDDIGDCVQNGQMTLEIENVLPNYIEGTYKIETDDENTKGRFALLMCKSELEYYRCG